MKEARGGSAHDRSTRDGSGCSAQSHRLPASLAQALAEALAAWQGENTTERLWKRDARVWTGTDEADWLGWLTIADEAERSIADLDAFAADVRAAGFRAVLLLGMGGSSLAPEVFKMTFGHLPGHPELHVLDSTDPQQVASFAARLDLAHTLVIVASKSGSTLEPNIFKQYFFDRVGATVGGERAGSRFVAITDPGSKLQAVAQADGFRRVFFGVPAIGGRYSALSMFGLVPAAAMGIDLARLLSSTQRMVRACRAEVPRENPGVTLGAILGVAALAGRDKLTVIASPEVHDLGAWLEQLIAESTGKDGKGIIPVDRERPGAPAVYGADRIFAHLRFAGSRAAAAEDAAVDALARAGHPVVRIDIGDRYDIGQEFFRWEIATAVAGALLKINPFDQPDVEASKVATRKLTSEYEARGALPAETPLLDEQGIRFYSDEANTRALREGARGEAGTRALLRAHLDRIRPGDYFALLAYLDMNEENERRLQGIRHAIRDRLRIATCLGFGPRFLHSTGQAYKGGPDSGVFLQLTCDDAADLPVPGQRYTFGVVKAAQARGDFEVLAERGRRALRVHLGKDVAAGLARLAEIVDAALA